MGHSYPALRLRLAAIAMLAAASATALAAPAEFAFSTTVAPYGTTPGPVSAFSSSAVVSGHFWFDGAASVTSTQPNGSSIYNGSFTSLSGSVQGWSFTDTSGYTMVGNDVISGGGSSPADIFQYGADPTNSGTKNFHGFDVPGYTAINVRMFWIEGQLGIPDYLSNQSLTGMPPGFAGRLAIDFVPIGGSGTSYVFFDGLTVHAVPEPQTAALWAAGASMLLMLAAARKRRSPGSSR